MPLNFLRSVLSVDSLLPSLLTMQIAIVGDSSSGKTSLFEALTGLPFPWTRRPLTSFAVQAQFRRTTDKMAYARAYIQPGPEDGKYATAVDHLESFHYFHDGVLTGDDFVDIVQEVCFRHRKESTLTNRRLHTCSSPSKTRTCLARKATRTTCGSCRTTLWWWRLSAPTSTTSTLSTFRA